MTHRIEESDNCLSRIAGQSSDLIMMQYPTLIDHHAKDDYVY